MHQLFHVVFLVAFLSAIGGLFLGLIAPVAFPQRDLKLPRLWILLLMAAAAGAGLVLDMILHRI